MAPDPTAVLDILPVRSTSIGGEKLTRSGPTVESSYGQDTDDVQHAIEISYEGAYELDEPRLADGSMLDDHFNALGGWVSSTLVRLGDLNLP